MQLGRVLTYTAAGGLVGTAGGAFGEILHFSGGQELLRLLAAVTLVWSGLSIVGVLPAIRLLDGGIARVLSLLPGIVGRPLRATSPLLAGIGWGLAPCAMVYSALMTAMLAGSPAGGAIFMAGFGLATIPAVAAFATGATILAGAGFSRGRGVAMRRLAGYGLSAIGILTAAYPAASLVSLCIN